MVERNEQVLNRAFVDQFFHSTRSDFVTCFADHFTRCSVDQVIGRTSTTHALREELRDPAVGFLVEREINGVVVSIHDRFLIHAESIEKRRNRKFAATVDTSEDEVFCIEFKVEPRTAVWNDAACEQQLTRRVGFTLVVVKEHARRTVHLGNDNTLSTVNDEGAVGGHQRHIAHEHVLFFDVFNRLRTCVFIDIKYDQTQGHLERCCVSQVALHTFFDVELRLFKLVFYELKNCRFVEVFNREYRLENAFNAFAVERHIGIARPQEQVIRRFLNLNEVRHLKNFVNLTVVLTQAFLAKEGLSHVLCHLSISAGPCRRGRDISPLRRLFLSIPGPRPKGGLPTVEPT